MSFNRLDFLKLISMALAPVMICLFYIYIRDKYEKEPVRLLVVGLLFGLVITVPIIHSENLALLFIPNAGVKMEAFYHSFAVAALVEEFYKFIVLYFLAWKNHNLNERFDGIVYSVFVSLGFAGIENIMYVVSPSLGGVETALWRACFSVPGHALFGVSMGYYFALAKFVPEKKRSFIFRAFFIPFLLHGTYDFILLSGMNYMMLFFMALVIYMWANGFRQMREHINKSVFKN